MPLHATEPEARLAPVAQRYRETRHACGQTNGGDDQPTILTVEASRTAKSAEIQRSPRFGRELWLSEPLDCADLVRFSQYIDNWLISGFSAPYYFDIAVGGRG
jgi:hypothetical protein